MIKKFTLYFLGRLPDGVLFLKKSSVAKNATALYIIQFAEYVIPLITIPYIVRVIGPEGLGKATFSQGLIGYFALFVDYGFALSSTRSISINRDNKKLVNKIFTTTISSKFILAIIGLIFIFLLSILSPMISQYLILMLTAYLGIIGYILTPVWLYQGLEDMVFLSYANIISKIIMIIGIFFFVKHSNDIIIYLFLISITQILYSLISFIYALYKFKIRFVSIGILDIVNSLKEGWTLFLSTASIGLYSAGNPFILGFFVSPTMVGYFSGAEKIARASLGLLSPISQSVFPRLSKLATDSNKVFIIWVKRILLLLGGLGGTISLLLFIFAPIAVNVFLGEYFDPAISILRILSPLPFLIALNLVFGSLIMLQLGYDKNFTKIVMLSSLINLVLVILLAPKLGASSSAIALILAEFYATLSMGVFVFKKNLLSYK